MNCLNLRNEVERAVIVCQQQVIGLGHMFTGGMMIVPRSNETYNEAKDRVTRVWQTEYISARLQESAGSVSEAAKAAGMPRQSFQRLLRELDLNPADFQA